MAKFKSPKANAPAASLPFIPVPCPNRPGYLRHKYGIELPERLGVLDPLVIELTAFLRRLPRSAGGLGAYGHFRQVAQILWPRLVWHDWLEKQIESLCEYKWVGWTGCAASGKTFAAALYSLVFWMADPPHTTVVLTSTTAKMIRKRAWAAIRKLVRECSVPFPGNMVDSKTTLQSEKGNDISAIFAQAVAEGDTAKAVANIQGIHNRRILAVIDEGTDTPEAAYDACTNLFSGCEDFQCLVIGNPASRFDPHGKFCEPEDGWKSVTVDDEDWETKPQLDGKCGMVLRFDAERSPNMVEENARFPFLVSRAQLAGARARLGDNSPLYWKFYRGFWAPDGMVKTILTESLITKVNGMGHFTFTGRRLIRVAGFDPAFGGGDRPVMQFADFDEIAGENLTPQQLADAMATRLSGGSGGTGINGLQLRDRVLLTINAASSNPVHFQLAEQARAHCEEREVPPENLAVDATGEGGGLCDIISRTWSNRIIRVEFGGRASDLPVSADDVRLCSEVYERKVTELWYQIRLFLLSAQLRGIDASLALELCNRLFDDSGRKIRLQTKIEMKETFGRSPDLADAATLALEAARVRGLIMKQAGGLVSGSIQNWIALAKRKQSIYANTYKTQA